jgi:hypothetical protein
VAGRVGIVVLLLFEIEVAHRVAMNAIERQDDHHSKVGDEHRQIEPVPVMGHRGERVIKQHPYLVAYAELRSEEQKRGEPRGQQVGNRIQ